MAIEELLYNMLDNTTTEKMISAMKRASTSPGFHLSLAINSFRILSSLRRQTQIMIPRQR